MRAGRVYPHSRNKGAITKTNLLLKENAEPTDSISIKLRPLTKHEDDARPGCTCDRWVTLTRIPLSSSRRRELRARDFRQ
jgi:hypothetical protein